MRVFTAAHQIMDFFSDSDCKKLLGYIGLTSEHSNYFETFCRKNMKLEFILDFICNFAIELRK